MRMTIRANKVVCFFLLGLVIRAGGQSWEQNILPLAKIEPGMRGVGKTVFSGEQVEEFGVQVLDIIKNFYPQTDIVLVSLTGDRAEHTGVVSGMSGSPVYIDGKLIGALALRFGEFAKEPIAGVMPIDYMLQVAEKERDRLAEGKPIYSANPDYLPAALCGIDGSFWPKLVESWSSRLGHLQNRIECPLMLSGFSEPIITEVTPWMRTCGFQVVAGGGSGAAVFAPTSRLEPGAAVSQVFISGDVGIAATGTVTAVDQNQVLAFGHHILNLGPTNLPMARSRILTTLSSYMGSSKMSTNLDILGSMRQDRMAGVYGELGLAPTLVPVTIQTQSPLEGQRRFNLQMANDPAVNNLMPLFLRIALFQCLVTSRLAAAPSSVLLEGNFGMDDGSRIAFEDFFSYEQRLGYLGAGSEMADVSDLVASLLGVLWVNDFQSPGVRDITISAKILPGERYARIRRVVQECREVYPGDSIKVVIELARQDGKPISIRKSLYLPKTINSQSITLLIGGGSAMNTYDLQTNPEKYRPKSFADLLRILKNRRRNDRLYLQWRTPADGVIVSGVELAALPPSVLAIMNHRNVSEDRPLRDHIIKEETLLQEIEIAGFKRVVFRIVQPAQESPELETSAEQIDEW